MGEQCQCPLAGYCARRKTRIPTAHWQMCQRGLVAQVDKLWAQAPVRRESGMTISETAALPPEKKCGCGTRLKGFVR